MVRHPQMRNEIRLAVDALADRSLQERHWLEPEVPPGIESFDLAVHILFDDTGVGDDADGEVGSTLLDRAEAEGLRGLVAALDTFLAARGDGPLRAGDLASPAWGGVVAAAEVCRPLLARPAG